MKNVVECINQNPNHKKWSEQQYRFRKYVENHGRRCDKLLKASEYCYDKFKTARDSKAIVHDSDIRLWALYAANKVKLDGFTASNNWINKFKSQFRISSRKICKFVSVKNLRDQETIENEAVKVLINFENSNRNKFKPSKIFNSDQSGFRYCHLGNRTLSFLGEKQSEGMVNSINPTTHSYTIQPVISMEGKLLSPLFVCLKESKVTFGPRVANDLPEFYNTEVVCSKSGKLDKHLFRIWVENWLSKMIDESGKCLLYMDGWNGQADKSLFNLDDKEVIVEYFADGSTSFSQPCDLVF